MLGRPKIPVPVFMNSLAGAWLNRFVLQVRNIVISSAMPPMCGMLSLNHMPACPCRLNCFTGPSSFFWSLNVLFMKANRLPLMNDSGMSPPLRRASSGFQSNNSNCDGPPAMNMYMTFLALGWKCGLPG